MLVAGTNISISDGTGIQGLNVSVSMYKVLGK